MKQRFTIQGFHYPETPWERLKELFKPRIKMIHIVMSVQDSCTVIEKQEGVDVVTVRMEEEKK